VADMQAASDQAQAAEVLPGEFHGQAETAVDAAEDISMEEVLGPGTHKKPVAAEEPEVQPVESQTV
ncbi:MAG: hypothetical protein WAN03_20170, partial [Candidatus Sulfotelmatobacter sp.]